MIISHTVKVTSRSLHCILWSFHSPLSRYSTHASLVLENSLHITHDQLVRAPVSTKLRFIVEYLKSLETHKEPTSQHSTHFHTLRKFLQINNHQQFRALYARARHILSQQPIYASHHVMIRDTLQNRKFASESELLGFLERETGLSRRQVRNLLSYERYQMGKVQMQKSMRRQVMERVQKGGAGKELYDELERMTGLSRVQLREEVKVIRRYQRRMLRSGTQGEENSSQTLPPPAQDELIKRDIREYLRRMAQTEPITPLYNELEQRYGTQRRLLYRMVHAVRKELSQESTEDSSTIPPEKPVDEHHQKLVRDLIMQYDEKLTSKQLYDLLEKETGLKRRQLYAMVHRERQYHL